MCTHPPLLAAAAVALLIVSSPTSAPAQAPGDLDPSYGGGDGIRLFEPDMSPDANVAVASAAATASGQLWVAGTLFANGSDIFVCRFSTSGGGHSCLTVPFDLGGTGDSLAGGVAVGPDGKAVVAGYARGPANDPDNRAVFLRLTTAMTLDPTFGGDGKVDDIDFSSPFTAEAVAVQPNGKIVWAGRIDQSPFGIPNTNLLVGRLLPNGVPDASFDGDGHRVVLFDAGGDLFDGARAVAVQPDGKLVVAGWASTGPPDSTNTDYAIARLGVNGSLDATFSGDGKLLVSFTDESLDFPNSVAIDRFGRIVVAGRTGDSRVGVVRLLPNGLPDPSFGIGGETTFSIVGSNDIGGGGPRALLAGDAIIVVGDFGDPSGDTDNFIAVLEPDGDLDPTFGGGDGKVTIASLPLISDPKTFFRAAALFAGKVLVAGNAGFEQPDIGFALRLWMSGLFRDDFETGDVQQWSAVAAD